MNVDSNRFFNGGIPLTTNESIKMRLGLCDEFSNITNDFCKAVGVPSIRVAGYVKHINFHPGDTFTEANHAWNAVYVDSTWMLCDLFWSITELKGHKTTSPQFVKKFKTKHFLASPAVFANDHLPSDPIFQFDYHPIKIEAFTNVIEGIDTTIERLPYLNYNDSISNLIKFDDKNRQLRIAEHTYAYNKYNPNDLIVEYYNYSVDIINSKTTSKPELKKVKNYLLAAISLIEISNNEEIKALKERCQTALTRVDKKLSVLN
jgi:transglutaminase/protease-like cytokinesis protein 3